MSATTKVGDPRKPNLLQISEEESGREGSPASARINIESNETNGEQKKTKMELNFHELWGYSYWRQFTSITPGLVVLFASGTQIFWTIRELFHYDDSDVNIDHVAVYIWYIGAIVGAILGSYLVQRILKRTIYYISAGLLIVSSIFFIKSNISNCVYIGRLLTGVTHGLIHLILLCHASDNASKRSRASILRTVSYTLVFGTVFAIVTNVPYIKSGSLMSNRFIGVYLLGYAIFTLVLTPTATNESVPYLIAHGREEEALQKYVQLRSERHPTAFTLSGFAEVRSAVLDDKDLSKNILSEGNWHPLMLIAGSRCLSLFLVNVPLLVCLIVLRGKGDDADWPRALIWLQCLRIVLGFVPILYCSALTRNSVLYRLGIGTGVYFLLLALIVFFSDSIHVVIIVMACLGTICFAVTALGLDAIQHVQSAEAFPLIKKPFSLAFLSILEQFVHILSIVLFYSFTRFSNGIAIYCLVCSIGLILISVWLFQRMPISSGLSLSEAREKYKT